MLKDNFGFDSPMLLFSFSGTIIHLNFSSLGFVGGNYYDAVLPLSKVFARWSVHNSPGQWLMLTEY